MISGQMIDPTQRYYAPHVFWTCDTSSEDRRLQLRKTVLDALGNPAIHFQMPLEAKDVQGVLEALRGVFPNEMDDVVRTYRSSKEDVR